jgi:redox-sensitive bicupin YhaK (pirin superfamily)
MTVTRTLPERTLPTVGAWCFLDQSGPNDLVMHLLPHPHIGLQTVSWLIEGRVWHRDSVGSDVTIYPGQLNLMTSGRGIAHSEFSPTDEPESVHLLQLWVALPDDARWIDPHFEQHSDLPTVSRGGLTATVIMGELEGAMSPAQTYTPLVGAELRLAPGTREMLTINPDHEYAVLVISGAATVDGETCEPGPLVYFGTGRDTLRIEADAEAIVLLLGGEPFAEELVMWWNFVGRSHEEIAEARDQWQAHDPRFAPVAGHGDDRIPAPDLPTVRLTPRRRRIDPLQN